MNSHADEAARRLRSDVPTHTTAADLYGSTPDHAANVRLSRPPDGNDEAASDARRPGSIVV